ncbi:MAG: tetratricopeptide repeat protein [Gammaproteobacteria bacterium]|jgi:tetratricopeptide (TPR) repeat protein
MKQIFFTTCIVTAVLLQGCATPTGSTKSATAKDKPSVSSSQVKKPTPRKDIKPEKQVSKKARTREQVVESQKEGLDPELLYQLMSAEIAGQRGQLEMAVENYLAAAERSQDVIIAERATRIAVFARDNDSALRAARIWVKKQPDNLEAHQVMAALLVRTGQAEQAQQHLEKLVESHRNGQSGFMLISSLLSKEKDKQSALNAMKQLVSKYKNDAEALYALSHLAYLVRNYEEAEKNILKVVQLKPDWTEANILYANILTRLEKHEQVVTHLESVLEENSNNIALRLYLARKYIDLKRYAKAQANFKIILESKPDHADSLYALGLLGMQLQKMDDAESYFLRLLEIKQHENEARYYLGQIAESHDNTTEAIRWYNLVEEGNHYLEAHVRIAKIIAKQGDVLGAREHLQNIAPDNTEMELRIYLAEGEILREAKLYDEAIQLYSDALEQLPDNIDLLYARGLTAEKLDNVHQTILDLTRIVEIDPYNIQALNALGYTLIDRTERLQEGFDYVRRAYERNPNDAAIMDSMGWAYYRLGNHKEALKYLSEAFEKLKDAEIAAHLGEVLWVTGKHDAAQKIWQDALRQTPEHKTLLDVIERFSE